MFECKYKYELEDSIVSAKYVYKSQRRTQDKIIAILIPILIVAMIVLLVVDIVNHASIVWDIILLVALVVLEIIYLVLPAMLVSTQKKVYKKQNLADMDYLLVKIDNNICTETLYKDGNEVSQNMHNLYSLSSFIEDNDRLILVFNKVEYVCIRKENLVGDITKLKALLEKNMSKAQNGKK